MEKYFLAIDIGASSGRHILGSVKNGEIVLEEIFRFKNWVSEKGDNLVWDIEGLYKSIVEGLKKCKEIGKIPESVGIDTWGVDYALLDKDDKLIGDVFAYRDQRTIPIIDDVYKVESKESLYSRTGTQPLVYNTIFQLWCDKKSGKLDKAESFLMVPDYLHFLLTGVKVNEYTDASTTGLLNQKTREWDFELIDKLGYPKKLFNKLTTAGTVIGDIKPELAKEIGYNVKVCVPATHDTASAVLAVPKDSNPLYISSGTWSLIGTETMKENTSVKALNDGYSNEGGYNKSVRFLKNIMGLWMVSSVKKELSDKYDFNEFVNLAREVRDFDSIVDVNDLSFFSPKSMIEAVKDYCKMTNQKVPNTVGEIMLCIYKSLAKSYDDAIKAIEKLTNQKFDTINIVGGGCKNEYLNELTKEYTGKNVIVGPSEATAVGNIVAQMLSLKEISSVSEAKKLIKNCSEIKEVI